MVFAKKGNSGTAAPVNGTTYTADPVFGSGSQIGTSGWYCVYNGTGTSVNVTGLEPLTNYVFHVIEFEAGPSYYTQTGQANPLLCKQMHLLNKPVYHCQELEISSSVAWGDYDKDGDLDILLTGDGMSKIYRNDGSNTFTEQTGIILQGVSQSSAAWGDYDNDGYLDILLTGNGPAGPVSKIYRNNGNNTFTEQTGIVLQG